MKLLVEIQNESKVPFIMEFLKSQPYIRSKTIEEVGDSKEQIVKKLKKASKNLDLYKKGKLKTISAKDFLNEL